MLLSDQPQLVQAWLHQCQAFQFVPPDFRRHRHGDADQQCACSADAWAWNKDNAWVAHGCQLTPNDVSSFARWHTAHAPTPGLHMALVQYVFLPLCSRIRLDGMKSGL